MINTILLDQIITEQQQTGIPETFVPRTVMPHIKQLMSNPFVIVITGIRRCGKSTLLQWIRHQSKEKHYYINFDDDRLAHFTVDDFQQLYETFIRLFSTESTFYFDEIQNILGWERFVRRLHDQGNKIYITGSNATMFSRELGTRLTGRYLPISVYPYSFREYVHAVSPEALPYQPTTQKHGELSRLFSCYLEDGGFPEYIQYHLTEYLHTLFENIVYKDILVRHKLQHEKAVKSLLHFLASNTSKNITYNSLRKLVNLSNAQTVADYCQYFENSFLCFFVHHFSASLKAQHGHAKKVYWIDPALAKQVGFRMQDDRGRMLENIVYLALRHRGEEVYCYQEKKECDFIIKKERSITEAIQVTQTLQAPSTRQREIDGLVEAMSAFKLHEGLILTEHEQEKIDLERNGEKYTIHVRPIYQWLLEDSPPITLR